MTAIISTTYDDTYLFYLPITTWCWNRLGVDVICFMPYSDKKPDVTFEKLDIVFYAAHKAGNIRIEFFNAPEHKEATYAQCSRLYAAAIPGLPDGEVLITSDIDMAVFKLPPSNGAFLIFGADLVPPKQYPMCYITASVKSWRVLIDEGKTYQEHLDELLGGIEAENFRGNYWGKDQETAFDLINPHKAFFQEEPRARPGTQFASNRVDRDDINWRSYVNDDLVDAHLWRPGYTDENFANILELLQMKYPNENLDWMREYQKAYKALL